MKPKFIIGIAMIMAAVIAVIGFTVTGNSSTEVKVNDLLARVAAGARNGSLVQGHRRWWWAIASSTTPIPWI